MKGGYVLIKAAKKASAQINYLEETSETKPHHNRSLPK